MVLGFLNLSPAENHMQRFHSRYEQLQRLREQCERLAKAEVASCSSDVANMLNSEHTLQNTLLMTQQSAATQFQHGISGGLLASLQNSVVMAEHALTVAISSRVDAETRLQQAMQVFHAARKETRIVDQVVDRDRKQHRLREIRHQDQQLQEQAAQNWYSRQAELKQQMTTAADGEAQS